MKSIFQVFLFVIFSITLGMSQNIEFVNEGVVSAEGSACNAFYTNSGVINNTGADQIIAWERLENNMPCDWFNSVCDINICYAPNVDAHEFELANGDTMYLSVNFYPVSQEASGSVVLRAYVKDNPAIADTLIYEATSIECENSEACVSSNSTVEIMSINMYPNPLSATLFIEDMVREGTVSIHNIHGQKVFQQNDFQNGHVDLSHLYKGTYIVVVNDGVSNHHQIIIKE